MSLSILAVIGVVVAVALAITLSTKSPSSDVPLDLTEEDILREAREGRKIQAIRWYRSLYGVGLKDAKEAVERLLKDG